MTDFKTFSKFNLNELRITGVNLLFQCAHSVVII